MNKLTQISRRQLFALATLMLLVPSLRLFITAATDYAGRAVWLTALLAALPMLIYMHFISDLMDCRREGENIQELMLRCLGQKLGRAALALTAAWLVLYAGFILRSGADRLITTVYPNSSPGVFTLGLGLVCLAAALGNPRSIVRSAMLISPVLIGSLLLILLFSLDSIETSNLLPVTVDDALPVALGSLAAVDVLSFGVYAVCFLEGLCPLEPGRARQGSLWLLAMVLLLSLLCLAVVGMFGAELCSRLSRPFFIMVRNLVFFRTVERVEALVVMLWLFPDFLLVSVFLYAAQYSLRLCLWQDARFMGERFRDMSRGRWLIWPTALAAIICSLLIGPDALSLDFWSAKLIPAINLIFAFIFIPSIYIVGKVRKTL